jgi:N utilization substance protein B
LGRNHRGKRVARQPGEADARNARLIDEALQSGWPLKRIDAVLRAALRAGAYELKARRDVPARVVITEYADVASAFVERDETGMVNAVLDLIARKLRADEFTPG